MKPTEAALKQHRVFRDLSPEHRRTVAGCAEECEFGAGEYVLRQGQSADACYVVRSGEVSLEISIPFVEPLRIDTIKEDDILGWSWVVEPYRWHFDARVVTRLRALRLDGKQLRAALERDHEFAYLLLTRIVPLMVSRVEMAREKIIELSSGSR